MNLERILNKFGHNLNQENEHQPYVVVTLKACLDDGVYQTADTYFQLNDNNDVAKLCKVFALIYGHQQYCVHPLPDCHITGVKCADCSYCKYTPNFEGHDKDFTEDEYYNAELFDKKFKELYGDKIGELTTSDIVYELFNMPSLGNYDKYCSLWIYNIEYFDKDGKCHSLNHTFNNITFVEYGHWF